MRSQRKGVRALRGKTCRADKKARQRLIYEYWDGTRNVKADPMQINLELLAYPGFNLQRDIQLSVIEADGNPKIEKESAEASLRLLGAIRQAFRIKPFADGGLMDVECLGLFGEFAAWWDAVKKKLGILPTSPPPTDSANPSATKTGADSGPISPESKPPAVSPSPLESASALGPKCQANGSVLSPTAT